MGLDYIRSAAGKPYVKRWAKGLDRLKTPSLLDVQIGDVSQTITATLVPGCAAKAGDAFLIQSRGDSDLVVFDGHREIARIVNPPAGLAQTIKSCHGMMPATVERIGSFGDSAELKLK
ncbi:hypothetical protein [Rhodoligotrophos ferricapiens]|uniref:hypothetical protein n=1 Tax=Rhodoligotrophos ferricapiens TaxID=3069264 RepID=UPI00315CB8DC